MTVQCCMCKQVNVDGEWIHKQPEEADIQLSHTYCPNCLQGTVRAMRAEIRLANRFEPAVT